MGFVISEIQVEVILLPNKFSLTESLQYSLFWQGFLGRWVDGSKFANFKIRITWLRSLMDNGHKFLFLNWTSCNVVPLSLSFVQLTLSLHWFGSWLVAERQLSHYVNQWRPSHTCHPISVCLNNQHTVGFHIRHITHDDVIKWKHFPRYWPFVRGIHRSPVNSPHKGQWRGALMFTLICARINGWVNNGEGGDLRRNRAHYDFIVVFSLFYCIKQIYLMICLGQCTCVFGDFSLSKILEIKCE